MMCPRNCGPLSFQLRRCASARNANRPLRVPSQRVLVMGEGCGAPSDDLRLTDEQVRRQHVERLELAGDDAEDALEVLEHAGRELVDEERRRGRARRASCAGSARAAALEWC